MKITRRCICGTVGSIELTSPEYQKYQEWRRGECYIQEIPLNACEREFLKTGLCLKCQKTIFNNNTTTRIVAER